MKMTKVLVVTAVAALLATTGVAASAISDMSGGTLRERLAMTDEQKAELPERGGRGLGFMGEMTEFTDQQLEELRAKMTEKLAQDLADGKITQEEYDAMMSAEIPAFGGIGHGFNGEMIERPEMPEMTDEQKAEMQAKMKEQLDTALAEGKITQEQYDAMINGEMPEFGGFGHGFRGERPELTDEQRAELDFTARKGSKTA